MQRRENNATKIILSQSFESMHLKLQTIKLRLMMLVKTRLWSMKLISMLFIVSFAM